MIQILRYPKLIFLILVLFVFNMTLNINNIRNSIKYKSKNKIENTSSQTTVISIYFKINKSKHGDLKYQK